MLLPKIQTPVSSGVDTLCSIVAFYQEHRKAHLHVLLPPTDAHDSASNNTLKYTRNTAHRNFTTKTDTCNPCQKKGGQQTAAAPT